MGIEKYIVATLLDPVLEFLLGAAQLRPYNTALEFDFDVQEDDEIKVGR